MWHRQRYQGENRDDGESQPSQNTPHPPHFFFFFLLKTRNLINSAQWHWESGCVIKLFHLVLRGQQEVSREHGSGGVSDPHLVLRSAGEESSKRLWAPKRAKQRRGARRYIFLHVISKENHDALCFYVVIIADFCWRVSSARWVKMSGSFFFFAQNQIMLIMKWPNEINFLKKKKKKFYICAWSEVLAVPTLWSHSLSGKRESLLQPAINLTLRRIPRVHSVKGLHSDGRHPL